MVFAISNAIGVASDNESKDEMIRARSADER